MENEKTVETKTAPAKKPAKPKKKENMAAMNTNLLISFVALCVLCLVLITLGITFILAIKAYFGGVLLLVWGLAFGGLNIFLNRSLFKKKAAPAKEETKAE